ncbi:MAG: ABC transporter substrate-binding protein [Pirellulaceae bacterium]|nr:ABC transporter substrate-binding protein [Pirellulaceae bacterium]
MKSRWVACSCATLLLVGCLLVGCQPSDVVEPGAEPTIKLGLNWFPDSQHGGFYAAQHFGFFADEGLTVKIEPGGPAAPIVQNVGLNRVEFGVGNADQILMAREQQIPVVALMAAMRNSPRCIMVHQETGIQNFSELADVKLALGAGKAFVKFLDEKGVLKHVQVVSYTGSIAPFLADNRFAQQAYVFSEPYVAEENGAHPVCMMVSDLGFNPYSSCLFTNEKLLNENPELVGKVVRAVRRGWQAYLQDPEPVNQLIHAANPDMDLESLKFGATAIAELCLPAHAASDSIGVMDDRRWQTLKSQLVELDFVSQDTRVDQAYTLRFLRSSSPDSSSSSAPQ